VTGPVESDFWSKLVFLSGLALHLWRYVQQVMDRRRAEQDRLLKDESKARKDYENRGRVKYILKGIVTEYAKEHNIPLNGEIDDYFGGE